MNELAIFQHEQFGELHVINFEGVEYFNPDVLVDVLGYKDADSMYDTFKNVPKEDLSLYIRHFTFKELSQLRFETGVKQNQKLKWSPNGKRFLTEVIESKITEAKPE